MEWCIWLSDGSTSGSFAKVSGVGIILLIYVYKTFIPSTDIIKSLFVREYLWKLPEGLLPDSFSVAKCKLHRFVSVNSKYGFRVCVHLGYYINTQHTPTAMMSQSGMRQCNFRIIRLLLDRADAVFCFSIKRGSQKYRRENDW